MGWNVRLAHLLVKHILIWGAKTVRATHFPLDIPVRHAHTAFRREKMTDTEKLAVANLLDAINLHRECARLENMERDRAVWQAERDVADVALNAAMSAVRATVLDKPIRDLTPADLDLLTERERGWVFDWRARCATTGKEA